MTTHELSADEGARGASFASGEGAPLSSEVWPDRSRYDKFVSDLSSWREALKLSKMEEGPSDEEYQEYETILGEAEASTLKFAREQGPGTEARFKKRVELLISAKMMKAAMNTKPGTFSASSAQPKNKSSKREKGGQDLADQLALVRENLSAAVPEVSPADEAVLLEIGDTERKMPTLAEADPIALPPVPAEFIEAQPFAAHVAQPTAAIEAVAAPVDAAPKEEARELSKENGEALAKELNTTKDEIDCAWSIIRVFGAEKHDGLAADKRTFTEDEYVGARREYDRLRTKAKELALELVGSEELFGAIKIPDFAAMDAYDKKVAARTRDERKAKERALPKEERDAYYDAVGRKRDFVQALTDNGVRKDMALGLYGEFADRAISLAELSQRLERELAGGTTPALKSGRDFHVLKWHGFKEGQSWEETHAAIRAQVESYNAVPPHVERVRPEAPAPKAAASVTPEAAIPAVVSVNNIFAGMKGVQPEALAPVVDEVVTQEYIDGLKSEGIRIVPGTTAAEAGVIVRKVREGKERDRQKAEDARLAAIVVAPAEAVAAAPVAAVGGVPVQTFDDMMAAALSGSDAGLPPVVPTPEATVAPAEVRHPQVLSWEELDADMANLGSADAVLKERALIAKTEWARREKAAQRYSREVGTYAALEQTLNAIKDGSGSTVPEKWLKEFHEEPSVAKYLRDHPLSAVSVAPAIPVPAPVEAKVAAPEPPSVPIVVAAGVPEAMTPVAAPQVVAVAAEAIAQLPPSGEKAEAVKRINDIKSEIDAQQKLVVESRGTPQQREVAEKARREIAERTAEAEQLAIEIAGAEALREKVKISDGQWVFLGYTAVGKLTGNVVEEYKTAIRRKKEFEKVLMDSGVTRGAAEKVYARFLDRAKRLCDISDDIARMVAAGEPAPKLTEKDYDYQLLKMHRVPEELMREGKLKEISDLILPIVEKYKGDGFPKLEGTPMEHVAAHFIKSEDKDQFQQIEQFKNDPLIQEAIKDKVHAMITNNDVESFRRLPAYVIDMLSGDVAVIEFIKNLPEEVVVVPAAVAKIEVVAPVITPELPPAPPVTAAAVPMAAPEAVVPPVIVAPITPVAPISVVPPAPVATKEVPVAATPEAPKKLSTYDAALESQWNAGDKKFKVPDWKLVPKEEKQTPAAPVVPELTAKEKVELDEVGMLWASFIEREYGLDIDGKEIVPLTEADIAAKGAEAELLVVNADAEIVPGDVAHQFETKFGVSGAMLENISVYKDLSPGQKMLVLRNLEQLTLSDIKKEAKEKQKAEWGKTSKWRRGLQMVMTLGMKPEHRTAEIEKELLAEARESGVSRGTLEEVRRKAKITAYIESLSKVALEGPAVTIENGEMRINYVSTKDLTPSGEGAVASEGLIAEIENFNRAASDYAKIPHDWTYREWQKPGILERAMKDSADALGLTKRVPTDLEHFEKTKLTFETARASLHYEFVEKFKKGGEETSRAEALAMIEMNKLDERVALNQIFNSNPNAEAALQNIEDASAMKQAAREFWKAKGNFMLYGSAARAAVVGVAGAIAVPTFGASLAVTLGVGALGYGTAVGAGYGVGRSIGKKQGEKLAQEWWAEGRMSVEDMREEFEYEAPVYEDIKKKKIKMDENGEPMTEMKTRKLKAFTDATFFTDRIDRLTAKLAKSTDAKEKALLKKKIIQTTAHMSSRFERGMINFAGSSRGEKDARKGNTIENRRLFMAAISHGIVETTVDQEKMETEAERLIGLRESTITDEQQLEIKRGATEAAKTRAKWALAGALVLGPAVGRVIRFGVDLFNGAPAMDLIPEIGTAHGAPGTVEEITEGPSGHAASQEAPASAPAVMELDLRDPANFSDYVKAANEMFERKLSDVEMRALWQTDVPFKQGVTSAYFETIQGKTHHAIVGAIFDKAGVPLTQEEINAIYQNFGYIEAMGKPGLGDFGAVRTAVVPTSAPLPPLPSELPPATTPAGEAPIPSSESWMRLHPPTPPAGTP